MSDVAPERPNIESHLLELLCDALDAAVFVSDKYDCLTFASRRLSRFFALPEDRLQPGSRVRDLLGALYDGGLRFAHSVDANAASLQRDEWIAERTAFGWRERHESQEQIGRDRWVRIINRRTASGVGITAILDISDFKKREQAWKADTERVAITEEILDELPVPVFVQDENLNFAAVNKAFCELQSTSHDSLIGRSIWDIFSPDLATEHEAAARRQLDTGRPASRLLPMRRPDGGPLSVLASSARVGRPGHFYLVNTFADITAFSNPAPLRPSLAAELTGKPAFLDAELPPDDAIDLDFEILTEDAEVPEIDAQPDAATATSAGTVQRWHALVISDDGAAGRSLVAAIKAHGHDACLLTGANELKAFLPAARQSGLTVDLLFVDPLAAVGQRALEDLRACRVLAERDALRCLDIARRADGSLDPRQVETVFGHHRSIVTPPPLAADSVGQHHEDKPLASQAADPTATAEADHTKLPPEPVAEARPRAVVGDVLVVEDNSVNRMVYSQIFDSMGLSCRIVANAGAALAAYRESRPSMVMIDHDLPDMTADAFVASIRMGEGDRRTPIVAVLCPGVDGGEALLARGVTAVIVKPLGVDVIDAVMRQHVLGDAVLRVQSA